MSKLFRVLPCCLFAAGCGESTPPVNAVPDAGLGGADDVATTEAPADEDDAASPSADAAPNQCAARPSTAKVTLPADDSLHTDSAEWWYWTGHLKTADGRWFGFEEVFFRAGILGPHGTMVHTALTDIQSKSFHHISKVSLTDLPKKDNGFVYSLNNQVATGGNGHDQLHGEGAGYAFDLKLDAMKRATLQGGEGYTAYSFGGYTYYYSRERMAVTGSVVVGGATIPVTGTGWFDHQYGDLTNAVTKGWDWFAVQLDDDREIMLFIVRNGSTPVVVGASLTDANCVTTQLSATEFEAVATGSWTSPHTGCAYPQGWNVRVRDMRFTVTPVLADQEVYTSNPIYWEGAATVAGTVTGRAYVELSGYCKQLATPAP